MNQNIQNENLIKIGNWVSTRLDKYESIIASLFLVLLILRITTGLSINILIVLCLATLATLYFYNAFSALDDQNAGGLERFVDKLVSFGASVAVIGILFRLERWPGYDTMIICGCVTLILLLPVILRIKSKKPDLKLFNQRLVIRVVFISILGFALNFASTDHLLKIGLYKNVPLEKTRQ